jgi:hypothetical protein
MKIHCLLILLLVLPFSLAAQATLRGTVRDADSGQPLVEATVRVEEGQGTTTDSLGRFRFEQLQPGRYTLKVSYLGYQQLELKEVLVANGKEQVVEIALLEAPTSLTAVTVKGSRSFNTSPTPNLRRLTQEETLRFPATFLDPGRLAMAYPGVSGANDQANHLIIRGQSPNGMHWRLEGLEIVNPNHTANAGTFSDLTTLNGGGVNAISAQLLAETQFHLGAFPANYGNATAGLLDMKLRTGNNERREYTLQAGLIGIDLAAEGPVGKQGSSFLLNYRYSATGLLSDLGVPLGDEDIRFQDLSFSLSIPGKQNDQLKIFGLLGASSNAFVRPDDSTSWDSDKYLFQTIDFDSQLGVIGLHYTRPRADKGQWLLAAAASAVTNERVAVPVTAGDMQEDLLDQSKVNVRASHRWKLLPFGSLDLGVEALWLRQRVRSDIREPGPNPAQLDLETEGLTLAPYLNWRYQIRKVAAQFGYRASWYTNWLDEGWYSEPRLLLSYLLSKRATLGVDYSRATQAPSPYSAIELPRRVRQWSLYWSQLLGDDIKLQLQLYDQALGQIAGSGARNDLNLLATYRPEEGTSQQTTEGRSRGVELSVQRFATGGWWYLLSGSVFESEYRDETGQWVPTRFATDYAASLTLGKEWSGVDRQERPTRLGANVGLQLNGGQRALPIDLAASTAAQTTVFAYERGFTEQLPAYFRADLRIYYQKNRPNWNSTLSLDIQNVTGQQNTAYFYYDRLLGGITERFQLEFIPIISYRVNF